MYEERDPIKMATTLKTYEEAIEADAKKGAAITLVMSGKASEGSNFADNKARAAIITGTLTC